MKMNFAIPAVALIAGAAIGYCCAPGGGEAAAPAPEKGDTKVVKVGLSDKASVEAMRARIKELEGLLAERGNDLFDAPDEQPRAERVAGDGEGRRRREGRRGRNQQDWLENMKRDDPERYNQVTNQMANFRRMRQAHAQSRMEFLSSVDTTSMSAAARETHERLQELLARRDELMNRMDSDMMGPGAEGQEMTEEERHEMGRTMWEATHEINELNRQERENLIKQTAEALGFQGEEVGEIASTIKAIIDSTEPGFGGPGGRGPGGPGGPGGRRGGRR